MLHEGKSAPVGALGLYPPAAEVEKFAALGEILQSSEMQDRSKSLS